MKRARYKMGDVVVDKFNNEWWWFTADNSPEKAIQSFKEKEASLVQSATIALEEENSRATVQTTELTVQNGTVLTV